MKCWNCNVVLEEDALYCTECGVKQETQIQNKDTFFCTNCGTEIDKDSLYCIECGHKVDLDIKPDVVTKKEFSSQPENSTKEDKGVYRNIDVKSFIEPQPTILSEKKESNSNDNYYQWTEKAPINNSYQNDTQTTDEPKKRNTYNIVLIVVGVLIILSIILVMKFSESTVSSNPPYIAKDNEIDLSEVDIDATDGKSVELNGYIYETSNLEWILSLYLNQNIYAYDENNNYTLMNDVAFIYLDDSYLEEGVLETAQEKFSVYAKGSLYISDGSVYMRVDYFIDEYGNILDKDETTDSVVSDSAVSDSAVSDSDSYILPLSDSKLLTSSDISGLTIQEINYAKNEIYARHGRCFKSNELQHYFDSKSWYYGTIPADNFDENILSDIEKRNATFLSDVEYGMDADGYKLDSD